MALASMPRKSRLPTTACHCIGIMDSSSQDVFGIFWMMRCARLRFIQREAQALFPIKGKFRLKLKPFFQ